MNIEHFYNNWKQGHLCDREMALIFFLNYHCLKYPNPKLQRIIEQGVPDSQILVDLKFKKVKHKALMALQKWMASEWEFVLLDRIPTPYEVLEYQSQGIRPVTIKIQKTLRPVLTREDCLEFFLHDLEHGHMFFYDDALKVMQIEFFKKIHKSFSTDIWVRHLEDEIFREKFHYLISDMNSHIEHYRQYLAAILPKGESSKFDFLFE